MTSTADTLLAMTKSGIYCPAGGFYIDPWKPVARAVITHAHADHARPGSRRYLAASPCAPLLRLRLGGAIAVEPIDCGQVVTLGDVRLSLHPAGHVLGSAQVRIEHRGEVWVVSGDYKIADDSTAEPFEPVPCHTFVTESTFGLPIFKWPEPEAVFKEIDTWWRRNQDQGRASILFAYSLGKAQRILSGVTAAIGPIYVHGAIDRVAGVYREMGISLPETRPVSAAGSRPDFGRALILAPPSAEQPGWMRRFKRRSTALASGWMQIRGNRRRRAVDRGFVVSDHADWDALNRVVSETGAESIRATHGYAEEMSRWFGDQGLDARVWRSRFGEAAEAVDP